jgi:hypothetical protein
MNELSQPPRSNAFMVLSLVMGALAMISCSFIFISLIAGGLSILFAILSKGNDRRMQTMPKAGILTGITGMVLSVVITGATVFLFMSDSSYRQQLNEACEQIYGVSFDDMMEGELPQSSDYER